MPTLKLIDDLQRELFLPRTPERIVSLVPSETANLFALGAGARLVGATDYCIEPEAARALPRVGGPKNADVERIAALTPDLVLLNQEENARAIVRELALRGEQGSILSLLCDAGERYAKSYDDEAWVQAQFGDCGADQARLQAMLEGRDA